MPQIGDSLSINEIDQILNSLQVRKEIFVEEPFDTTLKVVLLNAGDKYTPVSCINGEWNGLKQDIPKGEGIPKCPNGHVMLEGKGIRLGWIEGL